MKSKGDKLDVNKIVPFIVNLSTLNDIVKTGVIRKDVYKANIKKYWR